MIEIRTQTHAGILGGRPNTRIKVMDFKDKHSDAEILLLPMGEDEYLEKLHEFHLTLTINTPLVNEDPDWKRVETEF